MESELQKFRRRKQLEQKKEEIKSKVRDKANSWMTTVTNALLPSWNDDEGEEEEESADLPGPDANPGSSDHAASTTSDSSSSSSSSTSNKWLMYLATLLRILAWVLVYIGFIKIGFGAVFFTISLLIFIYLNTRRSRKRRKGEVSAYSVFNKDCQSIDGTLKAEHLEKTLLYRGS